MEANDNYLRRNTWITAKELVHAAGLADAEGVT
jgi:hypothetical protein